MRFIYALAILTRLAHADDAQTVPLRLDDLIQAALAGAPEIVSAQIQRVAARDLAAGEKRAQAWRVTATASYQRSGLAEHTEVLPGELASQARSAVTTRVERNLPTGGAIRFDLGHTRDTNECSISTRQSASTPTNPCGYDLDGLPYEYLGTDRATARATIEQPLGRGFGSEVALAAETRAKYAFTESTLAARVAADELLRDLVTSYWDLARASYELDVRAQALKLATKQKSDTTQLVAAGVVPESTLLVVAYELQLREEAMLRARVELEAKSLELRRRAGLEISQRALILRPVGPLEIDDVPLNLADLLARSRRRNNRLGQIAQQQLVAGVDIAVARDQTKPRVDVALSGAVIGQGNDAAAALDGLGKRDRYEVTASLSLSFEISGAARRRYEGETKRAKQLAVERTAVEQTIETEVVTAFNALGAARKRVALSESAIEVSQRIVRATQQSFTAGRASIDQVVLKQKELVEAQLARGVAVADFHKALATLEFLSGALFEHYRIDDSPR